MDTLTQIAATIEREALLRPEQRVLAAVSGGADSLCLAWTLHQLGYPLLIAHFDHGLRPESGQEVELVRQLAKRWQVPFYSERADEYGERAGSLEAWARQARYQFLFRIATKEGCPLVATGHTADDQVETILMNLLRGSGPKGLAGMPYEGELPLPGQQGNGVTLIRPLLDLSRAQTEACCRQAGLNPVHDPSNKDLAFTRNRIRHELLPTLAGYNPAIKETLLRTGQFMHMVADWMQSEVERLWPELATEASDGSIWLELDAFSQLPEALALSLIRHAHGQRTSSQDELSMAQAQATLTALLGESRGYQLSLPGKLTLVILGEKALLTQEPSRVLRQLAPQCSEQRSLAIGGQTELDSGWAIRSQLVAGDNQLISQIQSGSAPFDNPNIEVVSFDGELDNLHLRPPKPGDNFQPLGMQGSMKLSDFFINEAIPKAQRNSWPLLVVNGNILWVVGLRLSELAKVEKPFHNLIRLELTQPQDRPE